MDDEEEDEEEALASTTDAATESEGVELDAVGMGELVEIEEAVAAAAAVDGGVAGRGAEAEAGAAVPTDGDQAP